MGAASFRMSSHARPHPALCALLLLVAPVPVRAQTKPSALGSWEFDQARREAFVTTLKTAQRGESKPGIDLQIELATVEHTVFTFGSDDRGSYLLRTDKRTGDRARKPIALHRDGADLLFTESDSSTVWRLQPIDAGRILLIEEARRITIPLKRR